MTSIIFIRNVFIYLVVLLTVIHHGQSHSGDTAHKSNRYLAHLFHKYGSHGTISFEGLEHLMHNLGLGALEFVPKHTIDDHRPANFKIDPLLEHDGNEPITKTDSLSFTSVSDEIDAPTTTAPSINTLDTDTTDTLSTTLSSSNLNKGGGYEIIMNVFDSGNKREDVFRSMHDPFHRHPRFREHGQSTSNIAKSCLSPISLIDMYVPNWRTTQLNPIYRSSVSSNEKRRRAIANNEHHDHKKDDDVDHQNDGDERQPHEFIASSIQITPNAFLSMCPALLVQLEQGACNEPQTNDDVAAKHSDHSDHSHNESKDISSRAWITATISVTIISLCGLVGVAMVPLTKFGAYHEILRFLVAIAIGTLCGDALMHLLPHALIGHNDEGEEDGAPNQHDHVSKEREAVYICGCAFVAATIMYCIENLLPLISGHSGHGHSHNHNKTSPENLQNPNESYRKTEHNNSYGSCEEIENDLEISKKNNEENVMVKDSTSVVRPMLTPVAFMVVIGDGLHNLTDGMAIGAAFGVDPVTGMATALAVLCHELPHELGDFALLLQTGVSLRRAIYLNIISSVLSFIGMIFGLLIVNVNNDFVRWIYAGTSGTFLYIAFADLMPELNHSGKSPKTVLIQVFGIILGGIIMLLIALYEDSLKRLFD